ncbi:SPOR domain-containing protein [Alsobacter sp. SYSU M60028]|uniref:SPOR domain-containing protein n=1 Tax=Alsobacter ponti TaxID=2962936 RepID=A0ABT1LD44_9HYPH|nr:SPOR domain-containing protein [Alsobacter ponti]MCP8939354.1 SPOR domain-containing protein [Alsobacter ponti]
MTDQNRQRPAIDLDELERQLREAAGQRAPSAAQPASHAAKDDPLAELARIVGQEDYRPRQAQAQAPAPQSHAGFEDELEQLARSPHRPASDENDIYRELESRGASQASADHGPTYSDQDYGSDDIDYVGPPVRRRGRVRKVLALSVIGLAVVGAGAIAVSRNSSVMKIAGAPPVIQAETGPSKVQPEDPGGTVVPNQDRQIYNKQNTEDTKTAKVVNGEEQPVDVLAAARRASPPSPVAASGPATTTSTSGVAAQKPEPTGPLPGLGEPRRVKTVSVRPDGSVIDGAPEASAPRVVAAASAPVSAPAAPAPIPAAAPSASTSTGPLLTPVSTSSASTNETPARGATSSATATGPAPTPVPRPRVESAGATPAATPAAPKPAPTTTASPPSRPAAPTQVASAQPMVPEQDTAAATGGWAVQLAGTPSEQEAQDAASRLAKRFSAELGGVTPAIRKADVNGKTLYRVRVMGLTKEDATALCSRLQAAGGQCFVAKS